MSIELQTQFTLPDLQLPVEVILGRPEKGCPGHGICRLERPDYGINNTGNCHGRSPLDASLHYYLGKRRLHLVFAANDLVNNPHWVSTYDDCFLLEKPHFLATGIREACGLSAGAFLPAGHFKLRRTTDTVILDLPVRGKLDAAEREIRQVIQESRFYRAGVAAFSAGSLVTINRPESVVNQAHSALPVTIKREKGGRARLHFFAASLSPREAQAYFPGGLLHLADPLELGDETTPTYLCPGQYPVLELPGQYLVSLPLQ